MKHLLAVIIIIGALATAMPTLAQDEINIARAEQIITETYPGATIVSIQRIQQNNVPVWEARLADGTLIYVDAQSGEITGRVQAATPQPTAFVPSVGQQPLTTFGRQPLTTTALVALDLPAVSFEQALSIAQAQYPGTSLVEAQLEPLDHTHRTGPLAWDIKLSNGISIDLDAMTGQVLGLDTWGGRRGPSRTPIGMPAISLEQALDIAQGYFPSIPFHKIVLRQGGHREGYALVWEVDFGRRAKVVIDAIDGSVLRTR
jgi:uncharacterized membrane protein YkoI